MLYKFEESLKYHQETFKIYKVLFKGNHPDIAMSLNNVGAVYDKLGDTEKALKYHKAALKIRQEWYQSNHHDIAGFLITLALLIIN
ncbi:tetratricopeptide repeat protein [Rickettsia australis]|uniref:tetratricopeptide repeat protein n=1 Tax=Rickettsia australis TaxID=787 RepID=UPI001E4D3960|nr:tetratricopeptide repeat protein [Rickettsia australis]